MEGVITIKESRSHLDALIHWGAKMCAAISNSLNSEEKVDNAVNTTKSIISIAGTIATIIMTICPVDGPIGEILIVLATPQLVKAVDASRGVLKGAVNSDPKQVTAAFADVLGNVKEIITRGKGIAEAVNGKDLADMNNMEQSSGMQY